MLQELTENLFHILLTAVYKKSNSVFFFSPCRPESLWKGFQTDSEEQGMKASEQVVNMY